MHVGIFVLCLPVILFAHMIFRYIICPHDIEENQRIPAAAKSDVEYFGWD